MRQVSPKLKVWLDDFNIKVQQLIEGGFKPTSTNAREGLANLTKALVTDIPNVDWIQDDLVSGEEFDVPVRIYHPAPEKALPVLIYYHGGGGMAGSVTVYDPICRKFALATQHIVVSVDYRLAPECPFPAGVKDGYAVVQNIWAVLQQREVRYIERLSIAGDSGGGALAASVSAKAQFDDKVSIHQQVLIYPSLDYTMDTPSMDENAEGYLLQKGKIAWYFDNYFQDGEDRRAESPLYQPIASNLPETLIFTAEFCPLRDEGKLYCEKLADAGVKAKLVHFDDMIHAFLNMEDLVSDACLRVYQATGQFLNHQESNV